MFHGPVNLGPMKPRLCTKCLIIIRYHAYYLKPTLSSLGNKQLRRKPIEGHSCVWCSAGQLILARRTTKQPTQPSKRLQRSLTTLMGALTYKSGPHKPNKNRNKMSDNACHRRFMGRLIWAQWKVEITDARFRSSELPILEALAEKQGPSIHSFASTKRGR